MWISFFLCLSAGNKNSWKFYRDSLIDGASSWHERQRREAKYFPICFYQAFVTFCSISNNEQRFSQTMLKTLGKKCLYLAWIVSQLFSDTSECDKQLIPTCLSVPLILLQLCRYFSATKMSNYVKLYLKFKKCWMLCRTRYSMFNNILWHSEPLCNISNNSSLWRHFICYIECKNQDLVFPGTSELKLLLHYILSASLLIISFASTIICNHLWKIEMVFVFGQLFFPLTVN